MGSSSKQKYDTNSSSYDYVENQGTLSSSDGQGGVAVYQEAVLYHSVGPDVSKPAKMAAKTGPLRSTGAELAPNLYEAPVTQKFRVSTLILIFTLHTTVIIHLLYFIRGQVIMKFPRRKMFLMVLAFMYLLL